VVLIAISILCGWYFDIAFLKSGFSVGSSTKVNTALGLALLGLAAGISEKRFSPFFAWMVLIFTLLTFSEDLFHLDLGIDEFFIRDAGSIGTRWAPGRPSPVTLLNFFLLSSSILLENSAQKFFQSLAKTFILLGWILSFQAVVSYLEGVNAHFGLAVYTQMAVHTSISFMLLYTGILFQKPEEGLMKIITGKYEGSYIGKTLLLFAIFLPPSIAWFQMMGEIHGFWDAEFGTVLRIVAQVTFFSWISIKMGASLIKSEMKEQSAQDELRRAIRIRDEFLTIASHELRTPITGMKLRTEAIERGLAKDGANIITFSKIAQLMQRTHLGLDRMNRLVEDMLDISKIQIGKLELHREAVDLNALIEEHLDFFSGQLSDAEMSVSVDAAETFTAEVDRYRMEQVLTNLMTNAIRYAPHKPVCIKLQAQEKSISLIFEDGGPGIAAENHERIFQKFERLVTASEVSGFGLGLFIVREIVEAHQGTIKVESELKKGTRFVIELPRRAS
jgi:signal transduction histidine kinase